MGQSLEEILDQVSDLDTVNVTIVSNQDNGIASYAVGRLEFHEATIGAGVGSVSFARFESFPSEPLAMFFSDRPLSIDPPPEPFGPRQPFNANATEKLGVLIRLGPLPSPRMQLAVFGSKSMVTLSPIGNLLVGLGPSLGHSAGGVFVVAFTGVIRKPG